MHNTFVGYNSGYNSGLNSTETSEWYNSFFGSESGYNNLYGYNNCFFGYRSGYSATDGVNNCFFGYRSGFSLTTGIDNTAIGTEAGFYSNGNYNTYIGDQAGKNNSGTGNSGSYNSIVGFQAGVGTTGTSYTYNSLLGYQCGFSLTSGSQNTFMGDHAGYSVTTGQYNVFLGSSSGYTNSTASNNTFLGYQSGYSCTAGNNVFMGYQSGYSTTSGGSNVFLGYQAGNANTTGSTLTILGYNADVGATGLTNAAAIGANTVVLNNNDLILGDNSTQVGIGLSNDATGALSVLSVGHNGSAGWEISSFNPSTADGYIAVRGAINSNSTASSPNKSYAVAGVVTVNRGYSYGIYGHALRSSSVQDGRTYGVYGMAGNCTDLYNFGVYGITSGSSVAFAVYADGLFRTTNDSPEKLTSGGFTGYSDERLKKDVESFDDGLDVLRQIEVVTYKFNGIGHINDTTTQIGVIAQDVKDVIPYCVGTSKLAIKQEDGADFGADIVGTLNNDTMPEYIVNVMNYDMTGLLYVMLNSIKELDSTVTALQNQLNVTNQRMADPDSNQSALPTQEVKLVSQRAVLYQNTPNPANEETTINYYVSEGTSNAEMVFYDAYGKEIKRVVLANKGNATLVVNTKDLDAGIYSYSLVIDGRIVDTLRLVRVK